MDDWKSGISDLFATKEAEEAEQKRQKNEAGTGVISYFRNVVEPALNEVQAEIERQPNCEVDNRTYTNSEEYCGSHFKAACRGMPTFEMDIRAPLTRNGVSLIAKQYGHDKAEGRYSWETPVTTAKTGEGLSIYTRDQLIGFVAQQFTERVKGR